MNAKNNILMQPLIDEVQAKIEGVGDSKLICLETGTIRSYDEKHESTRHIGETLGEKGQLISVDIDQRSIEISKDICRHLSNINWVRSDSIEFLKSYEGLPFDIVFLDSVNDKDLIFQEFYHVLRYVKENSVIIIDDSGISNDGKYIDLSVAAQKAHRIWKFLFEHQIHFEMKETKDFHGPQLIIRLNSKLLLKLRSLLYKVS